MDKIAIFASGSGTNAENIIFFFRKKRPQVTLIVTDNPEAGVIKRAARSEVESLVMSRKEINEGLELVEELKCRGITLIVLAGFLGRIGKPLLDAFPQCILNIHPALLPKYGGKGMYGLRVHRAVLDAAETTSGITVHIIDAQYDEGKTLCQATCPVYPQKDTPESLAARIHRLEYIYFPVVIEEYIGRLNAPGERSF